LRGSLSSDPLGGMIWVGLAAFLLRFSTPPKGTLRNILTSCLCPIHSPLGLPRFSQPSLHCFFWFRSFQRD